MRRRAPYSTGHFKRRAQLQLLAINAPALASPSLQLMLILQRDPLASHAGNRGSNPLRGATTNCRRAVSRLLLAHPKIALSAFPSHRFPLPSWPVAQCRHKLVPRTISTPHSRKLISPEKQLFARFR